MDEGPDGFIRNEWSRILTVGLLNNSALLSSESSEEDKYPLTTDAASGSCWIISSRKSSELNGRASGWSSIISRHSRPRSCMISFICAISLLDQIFSGCSEVKFTPLSTSSEDEDEDERYKS